MFFHIRISNLLRIMRRSYAMSAKRSEPAEHNCGHRGALCKISERSERILHNGFGISEVAGGISERSGERPRGYFAYSVLCDVATKGSDEQNRNYFRSRYAEKERPEGAISA